MSNKKQAKSNQKKAKKFLSKKPNKYGMLIILLLALVILVINVIGFSYSWFSPTEVSGDRLQFIEAGELRVEDCSFVTYLGSKNDNGVISYEAKPTTSSVSITPGSTLYFRTVILNSNTEYSTNVSLFLDRLPSANGKLSLACTYPSNTFVSFNEAQSNVWIMRNACVRAYTSSDAYPGQLDVEWFIKNDGSSTVRLDLSSSIYLAYN